MGSVAAGDDSKVTLPAARTRPTRSLSNSTAVDVCICTFRRPAIVETLRSVAAQSDVDPSSVRIIVADNDETPSACDLVLREAEALGLDVHYVHAPARNISLARNACLNAAQADWVAFLDDDETASPKWLAALLAEAERGGWDAVLGPVEALYTDGAPAWISAGRFHSTAPVWVGGEIHTGYSGNVLIRRALVEEARLRFDPQFGRSGGEDVDFFYRFRDLGGRIGYAGDALATEPVPPSRARLWWLLLRSFRAGQTHATRILRTRRLLGRFAAASTALGKALVCMGMALVAAPWAVRRNRWLIRGALHWGVVQRLAGRREISLY
jgi:succinoglycan biosynthesis protein ExoM